MNRTLRTIRMAAVAPAVVALLMPANAHAIFGCLQRRNDAAAALYGSNVCTPQGQQLVCNYVPQTCYRTQVVQVPVTTYRPVTSCDPCTGCQTVCMKPQVCYQQQVKYVPYTSYRLQYSLQQPTCGTTSMTYYAPTAAAAAYVAPASGCSSCNAGAVNTTYYAPTAIAPATVAPAIVAPTTTYATPSLARPTTAYSYPSAPAGIGGYNYAPGATSGQVVSAYPGTTSGYATGSALYGGTTTTYAAPLQAAPAYSAPATTTYSAPLSSQPTPAPTYTIPATVQPSLTNPAPALGGSTFITPAPSTGSTTLGQPSPIGGSSTVIQSGGSLTPVPESMFASPAMSSGVTSPTPVPAAGGSTSGSSTSGYPSQPATNNPAVKSPYSSGVSPATGLATPAPALNPLTNPVPTPVPSTTPTPSSSRPPVIPMPDPEISGPRIGSPTSTPRLIDPEDKTAARWPTRRTYGYREVPAMHASLTKENAGAVIAATFIEAAPQPAIAARVESPAPLATLQQPIAPTSAMTISPAVHRDADGWTSSNR
ncbi:MAG: hypothetical protein QM775_06315 [Pirellulales bacterium]